MKTNMCFQKMDRFLEQPVSSRGIKFNFFTLVTYLEFYIALYAGILYSQKLYFLLREHAFFLLQIR